MKRIPGFENYAITKEGVVFNVAKKRKLKWSFDGNYFYVTLSLNSKRYFPKVHKLVAQLYVDNLDNKPYVNHKDGNTWNNGYLNLEWVTATENMLHAHRTGLIKYHNKRKTRLKYEDALVIRNLYLEGVTSKRIAEQFKIHRRHAQKIIKGDFFRLEPNEL